MSWQSQGIALLAASLVRPFALVAGAWLFIRAFKVRHPSSQHAVWTAVLLGMLLLPAVSMLTPHWSLPLLPHHATGVATVDLANASSVPSGLQAPLGGQVPYAAAAPSTKLAGGFNFPTASTMILGGYFFGLLAMAISWMVGWIFLSRLIANSRSLRGSRLRESSDVASPVTAGVLRPIVILPAGWRAWPAHARRAVLMHEFTHIRRQDTLALTLGRLVECVFWFHPLAWWLSRKTSELAEFACDATVLEKTGDPAEYSRTLIEFAAAAYRAGHRTTLPGLAMAQPGSGLGRRIDRLFEHSRRPARRLSRPGLLLAALGVPVLCLAATAGLRAHSAPPFISSARPPVALPAWVQSPRPLPRFDVVSVKPSPPGEAMVPDKPQQGGYWVVRGVPPAWLIYVTFETQPNLVVGMPVWAKQSRYDVEARMPPATTDSQLHLMLQSMLADRFRMVWHTEMRPTDVSILSASAPGPDLHPASGHCLPSGEAAPPNSDQYECGVVHAAPKAADVEIAGSSVTLGALATFLTRLRLQPVIAESGSKTLYDFDVTLSVPAPVQGESEDERKFDAEKAIQLAFRKQLGLDLNMTKTVKRPMPVLVIDHLAQASAN